MNKLEEAFNGRIKEKYGVERLETESNPKFSMSLIDDSQTQTTPNYHKQFIQTVKDKYHMDGLHMAGLLGYRMEQTLEDLSRESARANAAGYTLAVASVPFQKKNVKLFYEIKL
jgi:hypothetical protein